MKRLEELGCDSSGVIAVRKMYREDVGAGHRISLVSVSVGELVEKLGSQVVKCGVRCLSNDPRIYHVTGVPAFVHFWLWKSIL